MAYETGQVDWLSLTGDAESANGIPRYLDALSRAVDEDSAVEAAYALHELLCYAAVTVEEATVPAVRILYMMLAAKDFRWKQYVLQLIDSIACADGVPMADLESLDTPSLAARVRMEVIHGLPSVTLAERSEARDVKGAAIVLLADAVPGGGDLFDVFTARFDHEADLVLQADLAYAATKLYCRSPELVGPEKGTRWVQSGLSHFNPAVRYRIAQCLVESKVQLPGVSPMSVLRSAEPEVLEKRLFRREYL